MEGFVIIKPQKPPPKLDRYHGLSQGVVKTLLALESKYNLLMTKWIESKERLSQVTKGQNFKIFKSV